MEPGEIVWHIFAIIGGIKFLCILLPWLYWKLFCCINLKKYLYGYVLITGATDGIGKSLTKEFLRRGFKVLMVSRNSEKLESVKSEFKTMFPNSEIETITADFSYSHRDPINFYENLANEVKGYNISILVNNVGTADVKMLDGQAYEDIERMLGVNVYPSTMLLHILIPGFLKRYNNGKIRSLVINFSSSTEEAVFPGSAVYASTKRFNAFLSEGLRYEYNCIDFVTVKPGPVQTPMLQRMGTESLPFKPDSDSYARALLGGLRTGTTHGH